MSLRNQTTSTCRRLALAAIVPMMLAGCVSNPFKSNYVGRTQEPEGNPVRLPGKQDLRRLGTCQFDIDEIATLLPSDAQAKAAARSVGASAYWWTSRPKFHAGNSVSQQQRKRGKVGSSPAHGITYDEKAIKWYTFEAIFYADRPSD